MDSIHCLQRFMEQHVFAVWDFMCLLKELHRQIVSTSAPWFPPKDAMSANLISAILVEEEGDITEDGDYASHFDIYISAMENLGANTSSIKALLQRLRSGRLLQDAIKNLPGVHLNTKKFVSTTFSFFNRPVHEIAAAFVYGREGITAPMFTSLLEQLERKVKQPERLRTVVYYFKRHIALDSEEHFPKALKMLSNLIGSDQQKLKDVEKAAIEALNARIHFLTGIRESLQAELV
jgi:hypothetical protein